MATRALIGFIDNDDRQFVSTYNHYDGYPEYLGKVLDKHFNDRERAERVASTGYISSIDIDTGEIDSKYKEKPDYRVLDGDPYEAGIAVGEKVDEYGGDYGYIWFNGKWHMVKNSGIANMAKALEDKLEDGRTFMSIDENDDVMEEGYESKWANFLNEAKKVDFDVIEKYISKETGGDEFEKRKMVNFGLDAYMDSLKNTFRLGGGKDYIDYEMDDYVEDFENYIADKMDS
jgi:hypothetical protein